MPEVKREWDCIFTAVSRPIDRIQVDAPDSKKPSIEEGALGGHSQQWDLNWKLDTWQLSVQSYVIPDRLPKRFACPI